MQYSAVVKKDKYIKVRKYERKKKLQKSYEFLTDGKKNGLVTMFMPYLAGLVTKPGALAVVPHHHPVGLGLVKQKLSECQCKVNATGY